MQFRGWDRRTVVLSAFALLVTIGANLASAQVVDFRNDRVPLVEIHSLWRFHTGDDPDHKLGWANPAFDDSGWSLLKSDLPWSGQGYGRYSGFAWYRFKVRISQDAGPVALCMPRFFTSYELFADGLLIGESGKLPPSGGYFYDFDHIFTIPAGQSRRDRVVTFAIRVWHAPRYADVGIGGGPRGAPIFGELQAVRASKEAHDWGRFWGATAGNVLMLMNLVAAFGGFFLFAMRPGDREYLWFGLYELLTGTDHLVLDWSLFYPSSDVAASSADAWISAASWVLFLLFVFKILDGRKNLLFWCALGTSVVTVFAETLLNLALIGVTGWEIVWGLVLLPYFACILSLLYRRARAGVPDAQMLLAPVAVCYAAWLTRIVVWVLDDNGQTWIASFEERFNRLAVWPFPFSVQDVADMVMLLAVLAILPLRFARSRRDEERLAAEVESARAVQQVLVPAEVPEIPGFNIESIYRPAGQVGGDFFQIIPLANGAALVAIGDVSGKGMPAAMTVSLLVGTFRTLAHYTQSPGEILRAMNVRMLSRSKDGFTTCLVIRLDLDGSGATANAGHLAPYLGTQELSMDNGLPLGLSPQVVYRESSFHLDSGQELTLLTDGVVEARAKTGELFGFERTASLTTLSAEHIAATAAAFGQQDDITVLKIRRRSVAEAAEISLAPVPFTSTA